MMTKHEVGLAHKINLAIFLHVLSLKACVVLGNQVWFNISKDENGHLKFSKEFL